MFICDECRIKKTKNHESLFKSTGRCESCRKETLCNEIKSSALIMITDEVEEVDRKSVV